MDTPQLEKLNQEHGLGGRIRFVAGPGNLPTALISDPHAEGSLVLQGAHVLHYQPEGQAPVLWSSRHSFFAPGRPIRGGIPICWPWFGAHPSDPGQPGHGFARTAPWQVLGSSSDAEGTLIELGLAQSSETLTRWPHPFHLRLRARFGARLWVALEVTNTGAQPMTFSGALHTYLAVSDAAAIAIEGLEGATYFDKVGGAPQRQEGAVRIGGETDRVYQDTLAECQVVDPRLGRRICIAKGGSRSTVVWNPWAAKAARLDDFGDLEYPGMVCVETANAAPDERTLAPGAAHSLQATLRTEPL